MKAKGGFTITKEVIKIKKKVKKPKAGTALGEVEGLTEDLKAAVASLAEMVGELQNLERDLVSGADTRSFADQEQVSSYLLTFRSAAVFFFFSFFHLRDIFCSLQRN